MRTALTILYRITVTIYHRQLFVFSYQHHTLYGRGANQQRGGLCAEQYEVGNGMFCQQHHKAGTHQTVGDQEGAVARCCNIGIECAVHQ